ncbi:MAG: GNAT family N-acetyltransferase [Gemmatimonadota bacterium]|nr:GNAT family N-acetyltransferase [Gemmatimonadota bacterium]
MPLQPRADIPEIVTARLRLRAFEQRDLDAYADIVADEAVTRYLGDGRPLSRADAWRQMAIFNGHWTLHGFGIWAAEHRATGALLGRIGCFYPEGWPAFEIGYVLGRAHWGAGYATEGAAAALAFARDECRPGRIISLIRPDNAGSIRVAERLGGSHDGDVDFLGARSLVYRYATLDDEGDRITGR